MAVRRITETDVVEVRTLNVLLFGQPGAWKTSIAQTAESPYTIDFDKGIHRSFNRKTADQIDFWCDLDSPEVAEALLASKTVVVDTIGRALDMLTAEVLKSSSHGTPASGLNQHGWGALKNRFALWVSTVRRAGKDIIFLAHADDKEKGEESWSKPDIQGGTYKEVMKMMDLAGWVYKTTTGGRQIDFRGIGQTPGKDTAGWGVVDVPNLREQPSFMAELLADAKLTIGKTAAASAAMARAVKEWGEFLAGKPSLAMFNEQLPLLAKLGQGTPARSSVGKMVSEHAAAQHWTLDKVKKLFVVNGVASVPPMDPEADVEEQAERDAVREEAAGFVPSRN